MPPKRCSHWLLDLSRLFERLSGGLFRGFPKHLLWLWAFYTTTTLATPLPAGVEKAFSQSPIPRGQLSVWIAPVDGSAPLVDWQSHVLRPPASVTKIFTTGVGLMLLGENYTWSTEFYTDGTLDAGILNGNLYIKGHGNPYFVEEELREMLLTLQQKGIARINGQVILDNSYFVRQVDAPNAFDGEGTEPYNALPDALSINFRTATVSFSANQQGVRISIDPEMDYLKVNNHMQISQQACRNKRGFSPKFDVANQGKILTVSGNMSTKCPLKQETRVLGDAGDLLYGYFQREWSAIGGQHQGGWLYGKVPRNAQLLSRFQSKPLYEQITAMNKMSNNIMTRQLFLTLGAARLQPPGTMEKGRQVLMQQLQSMGVDTQGLFIDNGSGLSRETRMTAAQIGQFLLAMHAHPLHSYFEASLPVAGVDGTLKYRLNQSPLSDNLVGKTGTLKNVKAQAGYFTASSGRKFAYVMLFESEQHHHAMKLMDKLFEWAYHNH